MGQTGGVGDAPCGYEETETEIKNAETDSLSRPGEAVGDILRLLTIQPCGLAVAGDSSIGS